MSLTITITTPIINYSLPLDILVFRGAACLGVSLNFYWESPSLDLYLKTDRNGEDNQYYKV